MASKLIIRYGSHAEKDYLLKTAKFLDGVFFGANLVEATPAATASLIVNIAGKKLNIPYFIDPMTYAFGAYTDRATGKRRTDLDWIKSEQKIARKVRQKTARKTKRDFKSSYRELARSLGGVFSEAIDSSRAISPSLFYSQDVVAVASKSVVDYQRSRISSELKKDADFGQYAQDVPAPAAVIAPYFYVEPNDSDAWIELNLRLAAAAAEYEKSIPVHAIICVDKASLSDPEFLAHMQDALPQTGISGVWFWFSRFYEDNASKEELKALRNLVETLSLFIDVYNLHGGFFSVALSKFGLAGVSHGIGYGEQKDVIPVIGQSIPTVRYYLPDIYKRVGVPEIERSFDSLGIETAEEFHEKICNCVVCQGVVSEWASQISEFGAMHRSRPDAKRPAQTPAAAKRCRFHFLLNRIRECNEQADLATSDLQSRFEAAIKKWGSQPSMKNDVSHLELWKEALEPKP